VVMDRSLQLAVQSFDFHSPLPDLTSRQWYIVTLVIIHALSCLPGGTKEELNNKLKAVIPRQDVDNTNFNAQCTNVFGEEQLSVVEYFMLVDYVTSGTL